MPHVTTQSEEAANAALRGHRPHLDGLRAVAVYLVLAFHVGASGTIGGFIGVDVFFVLSGFLVTRVLLAEFSKDDIGLPAFYGKRIRRLLPAAVVALVGTAALYAVVASPAEVRVVTDSFRAALLYFANWHFISESSDYFGADIEGNPVLHFWSLSIEEQFYFGWPLILLGLTSFARRRAHGFTIIRIVIAVAAAASLTWAFHLASSNVSRAYYGTDARAYQLLAGALLALTPTLFERARGNRAANPVAGVAVVALIVLGTSVIDIGPIGRGAIATALTITLLVSLEVGDGLVQRALSLDPVTYLGQISYGTYLWHWPVIVVAERVLDLGAGSLFALAAVVATGVAALSARLLENPIRTSPVLDRIPRSVTLAGLAVSVFAALVVIPSINEQDSSRQIAEPTSESAAAAVGGIDARQLDWETAQEDRAVWIGCVWTSSEECVARRGSGRHIALMGDSHAIMMVPAFAALAEERDLTFSMTVQQGCSWHEGLAYEHQSVEKRDACTAIRDQWYDRMIPDLDPDVVVLVMRSPDDPARPVGIVDENGSPAGDRSGEVLAAGAHAAIERLRAEGRLVVIMEPIPITTAERDPLRCLSSATIVEECRYVATAEPTGVELAYRDEARAPDVATIDLDRAVCPFFPICDPVVGGMIVKWDESHLTAAFAESMADDLGAALDDLGALRS